MPRFEHSRVKIVFYSRKHGRWNFGGRAISGEIYEYRVTDKNLTTMRKWTFQVRVPNELKKGRYIEVKPIQYPQRRVWANIDRRTLNFTSATKDKYRKLVYAKLSIADVTGEKTKRSTRRGDRADLPKWIKDFRLRLKQTVTTTKGTDGKAQVAVVPPDDHEQMILLYLATKAWILYAGYTLPE